MNLPYKILAYINGIRFDPAALNYSSTEGQHAQFSLTFPGVPQWSALPERSHCAVFFADSVSNSWRLLCEGEYISDARQIGATGARNRILVFRSTHGMMESQTYSGFAGLVTGNQQVSAANQVVQAVASGQLVQSSANNAAAGTVAALYDLARTDLITFITQVTTQSSRISDFFPNFLVAVSQQFPVDAFYFSARKLASKMYALSDDTIGSVIDVKLFTAMVQQGWAPGQISTNTPVESVVTGIENITYYQHITVPAPPLYAAGGTATGEAFTIAELLFIPHLYTVIPPACNVVFKDQITDVYGSRNFMQETTRVVTQIQAAAFGLGQAGPLIFMSNDTERSVNVAQLESQIAAGSTASGTPDQTNNVAPQTTLAMFDYITQEEYTRGIIPEVINFPFQDLVTRRNQVPAGSPPLTDAQKDANAAWLTNYISHSTRFYYDMQRGANRRLSVNAVFLPYILPGLPCLIEDVTGPFWGVVHSVSHTLPATGQPSTQLEITHVRDAYLLDGSVRNAFNPLWLNSAFLPKQINATYAKLFGDNAPDALSAGAAVAGSSAAMVPDSLITQAGSVVTDVSLNATDQVNLDALAQYVIPIPHFAQDGSLSTNIPPVTLADKIRATSNIQLNCLKFQYRAGTTLTQFAKFHNLLDGINTSVDNTSGGSVSDNPDYVFSTTPPPADLANGAPDQLFGAPYRMLFVGDQGIKDSSNPYGVYNLQATPSGATITYLRQQIALTIKGVIDQVNTNG